ncbi:MAG: NTP transferase domain-containing protein [Phycisphaerales bacterium]|nr:NTP transferase domain-containing protein [Phycisphaerales bacterium]
MAGTIGREFDGVILAAGRGTRMAPFSDRYPKPLLPILNKPLICHQIEYLRDMGAGRIVVVIGHLGHEIAQHLGRGEAFGVQIDYVEQRDSLGIAHAVMQLEPHIQRPFAMLLGDIYFDMDRSIDPLARMRDESAAGLLAIMNEPDAVALRRNFAVHMDENRRVLRVVEKPRFPRTHWKGCGLYVLDVSFFDAVRRTPRTAGRNEYEITDAIQIFIDDGARVIACDMVSIDINLTYPYDVLLANLHALRTAGLDNAVAPGAKIDPSANLHQCVIGAGARIGPGASLRHVVVMPNSVVSTREPIDRTVITVDQMVDCRYWVNSGGAPAGRGEQIVH